MEQSYVSGTSQIPGNLWSLRFQYGVYCLPHFNTVFTACHFSIQCLLPATFQYSVYCLSHFNTVFIACHISIQCLLPATFPSLEPCECSPSLYVGHLSSIAILFSSPRLDLPLRFLPSVSPPNTACISFYPHKFPFPFLHVSPPFDHRHHIWWPTQIMQHLRVSFHSTCLCFLPLRSKYLPQYPVLGHH